MASKLVFEEKYELWIGNLPYHYTYPFDKSETRKIEKRLDGIVAKHSSKTKIVGGNTNHVDDFTYAFVRVTSEAAFLELIGQDGEIGFEGSQLYIRKSNRISSSSSSDSSGSHSEKKFEQTSEKIKSKSPELENQEKEYQRKLKELQEIRDNVKKSAAERIQKKTEEKKEIVENLTRYERWVKEHKIDAEKCDTEIAAISQELSNAEELYEYRLKELKEHMKNYEGKNSAKEIIDELDCIVCYEPMGVNGAAIYQCMEGHLICPNCYQKVSISRCPTCRKVYPTPAIRNRFAENFACVNKKPAADKEMHQSKSKSNADSACKQQ